MLAGDVMVTLTSWLDYWTIVSEARSLMERTQIEALPVTGRLGGLGGVLTWEAVQVALAAGAGATAVGPLARTDCPTVYRHTPLTGLETAPVSRPFIVLDEADRPVGLIPPTRLHTALCDELHRRLEFTDQVVDAATGAAVAVDGAGRVTLFSYGAEAATGIPAAEAVGQAVEAVLPSLQWYQVMATGAAVQGEVIYVPKGQVTCHIYPVTSGTRVSGAVAVIPQPGRAVADATAVDSLAMEAVFEDAYDGIIVVDHKGTITAINQAYAEWLGLTRETVIGRHCTEIMEHSRLHIVARTGIAEIGQIMRLRGHDMVVHRFPIIRDGTVAGVVGKVIFKDVADLRAMARSLYPTTEAPRPGAPHATWAARYTFDQVVGRSTAIAATRERARRVAAGNATVLLVGESGTGKELFAHAIHAASRRTAGPFVRVNCAAIPRELLESELFGYEGGAFTGARKQGMPGKVELASSGTLFLDEVGDMPLDMQAKLLRVLQEREITRIGGNQAVPVDIRVIAATHQDLARRMAEGRFRADLYYRLNVVTIEVPPLRARPEDIPMLVDSLLPGLCRGSGRTLLGLDRLALTALQRYPWPGNVRELVNVLETLVYTADGPVADLAALPENLRQPGGAADTAAAPAGPAAAAVVPPGDARLPAGTDLSALVAGVEKAAIIAALRQAGGNRMQAARLLGIHRSLLYSKMARYRISETVVINDDSCPPFAQNQQ